MDNMNWNFSKRFGGHWVKVKFYKKKPNLKEVKREEGARFCEAVKKAVVDPILLNRDSISCQGAQHAFGWSNSSKEEFLNNCRNKNQAQIKTLKSLFSKNPRLKKPFEYIGLNTDGNPDVIISFMLPEGIKELLKIYNYHYGSELGLSLSSMMSICSGIAVKSYLEKKISVSFGCDDSRKFTDIGRDRLVVGIPKKLFKVFLR